WELRLAGPAHEIAQLLVGLVRIEESGADWLRYRCADARAINPQIIARLAAHGAQVIGLSELPRRLEDVYLSIVEKQNVDRGAWSEDGGDRGWGIGDGEQPPNRHPLSPIPQLEEVQP